MTKEHKDYLDKLRESGNTNMYGASIYLVWEFGLSKKEARNILSEWMSGFNK